MIMTRKVLFLMCFISFTSLTSAKNSTFSPPVIDEKISAGSSVERIFTVKKWGRYRITAESQEGAALQLIDRKVGIRKRDGVPGEENGRIDEFLDIGEYKLAVTVHPDAESETRLRVIPFKELNTGKPQYMIPAREYSLQLRDGQQASWWIHCENDTTLLIEAYGRCVADMQLWLNGQWRIDAQKCAVEAFPAAEKPLRGFRLVQHVKAGYYLCSVYGGEAAEWAKKSKGYPLYVRAGLPKLPRTGYSSVVISAKGLNNYYVQKSIDAVIMERDTKKRTDLVVLEYPATSPSARIFGRDSIHEKSADTRCIVRPHSSGRGGRMVQIIGKPGDKVHILTFGTIRKRLPIQKGGEYWLSTFTSGDPEDRIGACGVVADLSNHSEVIADRAEVISAKHYFSRSFNLLETVSLVVRIGEDAKYDFIPDGTEMSVTVRRLVALGTTRPGHIGSFDKKETLRLEKGYYEVTLSPKLKGIGSFRIKKSGMVQLIKGAVGAGKGSEHGYANVQFPLLELGSDRSYEFHVNSQAPEITGTVFRKLPLHLDEALPVYVDTGKTVKIPVSFREKSVLTVADAAGKTYSCRINGVMKQTPCRVSTSDTLLQLSTNRHMLVSVSATPVRALPDAPPEPFPTGEESPLPIFPKLQFGETVWFDLDRNDNAVYEFVVPEPGMYRFETLGRLRTSLTLRDRFVVNALTAEANGIGRNARILTYLLPGTYQAMVATQGRTTGHLALSLMLNETIDAGKLTTDSEKKHRILPGQGIIYTVDVKEEARYDIVSEGQSGFYSVRFDDDDGWPITTPLSRSSISTELKPGSYRLISIPEQRTTLRTARITRKEFTKLCKGKGPHRLYLNRTASGVWKEEADTAGNARRPVRFSIDLPATDRYRMYLTEGFTATVTEKNSREVIYSWSGTKDTILPMGNLVCSIMADEKQELTDYTIGISTKKLMKGLEHSASGYKTTLDVAVGEPGVYEFFSQGTADVTATLLKGKRVIDVNDDAPFDWNFRITRMLMPGTYSLDVESAAQGTFSTLVKMSALEDSLHTQWTSDTPRMIDLGGKMHRIVVTIADTATILHVAVKGNAPASCQIQKIKKDGGERACGSAQGKEIGLSVPVESGRKYAVYVWSVDHTDENVSLAVLQKTAKVATLSELRKGKKVDPVFDGNYHYLWLKMDMETDTLGQFTVHGGDDFVGVKTAHVVNAACKNDVPGGFITLRRYRWAALCFEKGGRKKVVIDHCSTDEPVRLPLERYPRAFRIPGRDKRLQVVSAKVIAGRPMCGIRTGANGTGVIHPYRIAAYPGIECGAGKTMAVDLPDDSHVFMAWNAVEHQLSSEKPDMVVERAEYDVAHLEPLVYGRRTWNAPEKSACSIAYAKNGPAFITVTIPKGGVALWRRPDGTRRFYTTDLAVRRCEFQESAGTLYLVNSGRNASFSIDCIALDTIGTQSVFSAVANGMRFEKYYPMAGVHSVAVPWKSRPGGMNVSFSGAVTDADWWSGEGRVTASIDNGAQLASHGMRGRSVAGGYFNFRHDAGWVKIDLCGNKTVACEWGNSFSGSMTGPQLRFSQALTLKDGVNWFSVVPDKMMQVRLETDVPVVLTVLKDGDPLKTVTAFNGCDVSFPLVKGKYSIGCRGAGNASLQGVPMKVSLLPVAELTQKEPPEILMAAGECRMFHVTIPQKTKIGLGLETVNEVIAAVFYDAQMREVGRGQQQFLDLDAGDYYLELNVERGDLPTRCTVRLVGQDVPPDNPPQPLLNRLMKE